MRDPKESEERVRAHNQEYVIYTSGSSPTC